MDRVLKINRIKAIAHDDLANCAFLAVLLTFLSVECIAYGNYAFAIIIYPISAHTAKMQANQSSH